MFWYIKSQLEVSYAMQSSRVAAFLPDLMTGSGSRYFDTIKSKLDQFKALENHPEPTQREVEVIVPKNVRNVTYEQ
jgi:4-diphosphocytidyl-2C-methyl-D-erythritol kinase